MDKLKVLLSQTEFHAFLFFLCMIVFSQPLLTMSNAGRPETVLLSLFVPWAIIILLLFVTSRSYIVSPLDEGEEQENGEMTDA